MTYNVFGGTLNLAQSQSLLSTKFERRNLHSTKFAFSFVTSLSVANIGRNFSVLDVIQIFE